MHIKIACPLNSFRGAFMRDRWEITGLLLAFLPGLLLAAPVVGYLFALLGLPFGWFAWAITLFVAVQIALHIREHFKIVSWGELLGLAILLIGIAAAYAPVSLSMGSGSTAAAAWYKSLNLLDGGHLYRSMPWLDDWVGAGVAPLSVYEQYGALAPDAQYTFGNLHFMGLPGGAWFFAWWAMIARALIFTAPLMVMLAAGTILNRLLHKAMPRTGWPIRLLFSLVLVAMPMYLYFGRGMYPALYALPCYVFALLLLLHGDAKGWFYPAVLVVSLAIPILCGTDFILPFFVAVLLLAWHKPAWGLALGGSGVLLFYGLGVIEPLWFGQVIGMPIWVRQIAYVTIGFYLAGLLLYRFFSREKAEKWTGSTWLSIVFYAGILGAVLFLFKKNGAFSGFGALTLAFSGVVLLGGLISFPAILRRREWPLIFRLFAAGLFVSQLIFFRERPIQDVYTGYLPFIALILPLLWFSSAVLLDKARGWPRYLVLGSLLAMMLAQSFGAGLIPYRQGAGEDLQSFARQVRENDARVLAYDAVLDQSQVPLVWYSGAEPAPILQGGEIGILDGISGGWLYVTGRPAVTYRASGSLDYIHMPPGSPRLPAASEAVFPWNLLGRDDILREIDLGSLYPSITWRAEGLGQAGATHARCVGLGAPVGDNRYLIIETPAEVTGLLGRDIKVCADGEPLPFYGGRSSGHVYMFKLPQGMDVFSAVDIYLRPLPGAGEEDPESGIRIMCIRLSPSSQ